MAQEVYDNYVTDKADIARVSLPEMPVLRYLALRDFLDDWQYPPNLRRNLFGRIKVERPELYEKLKQQEQKLLEQAQKQEG